MNPKRNTPDELKDEQERQSSSRSAPSLGALLAQHALAGTLGEDMTDRPSRERLLGPDLE